MRLFTGILIGATIVSGGIFLFCAGVVAYCYATEPPGAGAGIGWGLLTMAAAINFPAMLGWAVWLSIKVR
jgi:hypothetical protein